MDRLLTLPHRAAVGMCPVNGIRDLVQWRTGRDWSNQFVFGLGLGGGFTYLRINPAHPPRQVYWGNASPKQQKYLAELLGGRYTELEGRSFKFALARAQDTLAEGSPLIIGPLDMYHLPFYEEIYHQRHIPIHYLLLVGCDGQTAYVYDTAHAGLEEITIEELRMAWDVHIPGLGKRNRLVSVTIPETIPCNADLIRRSIRDECRLMLDPPVSMLGIPAMQKLARELAGWPEELGMEVADRCLLQVREYLSSPPDVMGNYLTAGRDVYITFLRQGGEMAGYDFHEAINRFEDAMQVIPEIADAIQRPDLEQASKGFAAIAQLEKEAFTILCSATELK